MYSSLQNPSQSRLVIFVSTASGLGSLRAMDALYTAHSQNFKPLILTVHDFRIDGLHYLTELNYFLRKGLEDLQTGFAQDFFTKHYRRFLRFRTASLYRQMSILFDQFLEIPKEVLIVTAHFSLAHQLAAIKSKLEWEKRVKIKLVVQMTDASPLNIWFVPGADLISVPHQTIKDRLNLYRIQKKLQPVKIEVLPFPLNKSLIKNFSTSEFVYKQNQLNPNQNLKINLSIPLPRSAVNLEYFSQLLAHFKCDSLNYQIFLVTKFSQYTKRFIYQLVNEKSVQIYPGKTDQQVVTDYLRLFLSEVIALEITPPTEQVFKVLLDPVQRGGAIMLFCRPSSRVEKDNVIYMRSHGLIPDLATQKKLWHWANSNKPATHKLIDQARSWRGVLLPLEAKASVNFINWLHQQRIFVSMLKYKPLSNLSLKEISDQGSVLFWKKIERLYMDN